MFFKGIQFKVEEEVTDLRMQLDNEKQQHQKDLADIEQDKINTIEKMRRDMLLKVKEVKTSMLNLNEDKLHGVRDYELYDFIYRRLG